MKSLEEPLFSATSGFMVALAVTDLLVTSGSDCMKFWALGMGPHCYGDFAP